MKSKTRNILPLVLAAVFLTRCTSKNYVTGVSRSQKSYCIAGTWHHPQKHYDYDKVGLASWYGPNFHGKKKAQGEYYDQYSMTAAHKTLPLPTIVKVTNMENGKSIVILIDDRGPFKYKGRIIDLSSSAAKELGLHNKGIGKVRVQSLVKESNALSIYLKNRAKQTNRPKKNWEEIYRTEVCKNKGYTKLSNVTPEVQLLNTLEVLKGENSQPKLYTGKKQKVMQPEMTPKNKSNSNVKNVRGHIRERNKRKHRDIHRLLSNEAIYGH